MGILLNCASIGNKTKLSWKRLNLIAVTLVRDCPAPAEDHPGLLSQARRIKEAVARVAAMAMDPTEMTCIKAIVLFRPGKKCFELTNLFRNGYVL